jgi:hypothetical protein
MKMPTWSEMKMSTSTANSFNKAKLPGHFLGGICRGVLLLPAGHGGDGEEQLFTPSDLLPEGSD